MSLRAERSDDAAIQCRRILVARLVATVRPVWIASRSLAMTGVTHWSCDKIES